MRKLARCFLLSGILALGTAFPAFANFSWQVENMNTDYVGTATVTVKDWEGNTYSETAPVVRNGAVVTFTELDNSAEFFVNAYDTEGNPITDFGGTGISGSVSQGDRFQYRMDWDSQKGIWNSSFEGQAGIFEIGAYDYAGGVWQQKFIIDGACSSSILSNVQRTNQNADSYTWRSNSVGWWVERPDGTYLTNSWYQSPASSLWYYMGADGYMLTDTTTPDGYYVNADGVWVQ
ncbi:MAG TPA: hypothetical protein IAB28_01895 [Candidatus Copromonas faecavium]|uniref:Cell wall-binding protein n=1 Tax=Candidatus Copromonas faecavium (nom. illeg.) TaxID=2840740 RepID=A0A9D1D4V9_9FIRM|nr:hypothetical protein [Candidatus Copromonas faecavium]